MWISNYARGHFGRSVASHKQGETIDQPAAAPVNELLADAMQAVAPAQIAKQIRAHGAIPPMRPVENLQLHQRFGDRLGKPLAK